MSEEVGQKTWIPKLVWVRNNVGWIVPQLWLDSSCATVGGYNTESITEHVLDDMEQKLTLEDLVLKYPKPNVVEKVQA